MISSFLLLILHVQLLTVLLVTCLGEHLFVLNLFERLKNFMNLATRTVGALRGDSQVHGHRPRQVVLLCLSQWHMLSCGGWLQLFMCVSRPAVERSAVARDGPAEAVGGQLGAHRAAAGASAISVSLRDYRS